MHVFNNDLYKHTHTRTKISQTDPPFSISPHWKWGGGDKIRLKRLNPLVYLLHPL